MVEKPTTAPFRLHISIILRDGKSACPTAPPMHRQCTVNGTTVPLDISGDYQNEGISFS